ncbi:signal peptide peptidase SppA [Horticoccus luteus]|uniref:Signal peptide peptidase SppA n=1 Tax=Horticoccus luteus TaxID=2862869 RepID=A0A8F9TR68_9BACT|nr:signal peptide peptidase SppA [Horticoccus luteus]QYM77684.1 signal peptide peptidase SppA [Horticoccus luteus]
MRNFITSMLGSLVALVIFAGGAVVVMVLLIGALAALGQKHVAPVENGSFLVFNLSTNIVDGPPEFDLSEITGGRRKTLQVRNVTRALQRAAHDDRIKGVVLIGSISPAELGSGYAALREVRGALMAVRKAGKPVHAYLTYATTRDYYLASVASDIALDPYGMIVMPGLASEPVFFAGAFEKYGIGVQVTRVGKYKSYVEPFTRKEMSPENREETQRLLSDIWGQLRAEVGRSRGISAGEVQRVVDAEGLIRPEAARDAKLVDRVVYRDELIDELKTQTGRRGSKQSFKQIALDEYIKAVGLDARPNLAQNRGKIGLVYAEGSIVDGEGDRGEVGGTKFARALRDFREDDAIKAIVIRVNSPGGSVSASEAIQREVRLAREKKPVVISMGSYAASGGYWISTYGNRIFAEPTTITGSIGVFGIQFDVKRLANDFGITFDSVKTGKFADAITISRPKTPEELAIFQRMVDWIYGEFVRKVAESRHLDPAAVEEIAQGRVWSGSEAKKLGLVDEIGGLEIALQYAAKEGHLGRDYRVEEFPRKKDLGEAISDWLGHDRPGMDTGEGVLREITTRVKTQIKTLHSFNDPAGLYARLPLELSVK